jgi:signal transduction histidine kinase
MLFAAAGWSGTLFSQTIMGVFWTRNLYPVIGFFGAVGTLATLWFALDYCGYHDYVTKRRLSAFAVYPPAVAILSFLNPSGLFFSRGYPAETLVGYHYDLGPLFAAHVVISYIILLVAITLIFAFVVRFSRRMFRGQAVALFVGNLAPLLAGLPAAVGYTELDVTPIGFFIATTAYAVAVTRYRLADLTPVGRDQVLDSLQNGVVVVDTNDRVIDYNDATLRLLNRSPTEQPTGDPIHDLFGDQSALTAVYEDAQSETAAGPYPDGGGGPGDDAYVREVEREQTSLQISITRLEAGHPIEERTVITLEDISLQKRRERQLRQQVEQLDQFTSIVSHDLRNPLSVAAGYVEQAEETGDTTHLAQSKDALDRMDGLIEDMLTVAKQSQNAIEPVSVSVREAATEAWENVETEQMSLDIRGDCAILADPGPFGQLLENLYRNAREHGPPTPLTLRKLNSRCVSMSRHILTRRSQLRFRTTGSAFLTISPQTFSTVRTRLAATDSD